MSLFAAGILSQKNRIEQISQEYSRLYSDIGKIRSCYNFGFPFYENRDADLKEVNPVAEEDRGAPDYCPFRPSGKFIFESNAYLRKGQNIIEVVPDRLEPGVLCGGMIILPDLSTTASIRQNRQRWVMVQNPEDIAY